MTAYLTVSQFKLLTLMPGAFVDAVEAVSPGFTDAQLNIFSAWLDARLAKRYGPIPWTLPAPTMVQAWLARIVTPRVWHKRGVDPTDQQFQQIVADDVDARAEVKEAADSDVGLFDLPLLPTGGVSGVTQGFPRSYSEASPYVAFDQQADLGRCEDEARMGTFK
jgi:hypothetical protein